MVHRGEMAVLAALAVMPHPVTCCHLAAGLPQPGHQVPGVGTHNTVCLAAQLSPSMPQSLWALSWVTPHQSTHLLHCLIPCSMV